MEEVVPNGLSLSLDDLISKNRSEQRRPRSSGPRGGGFSRHDGPQRGFQERRHDDRQQHFGADRRRPHHHHQGEERRGPRPPPPPPPPRSNPAQYRRDQKCFLEEATGTVVFKFKATELVRITPAGDITLDAAGRYNVSVVCISTAHPPARSHAFFENPCAGFVGRLLTSRCLCRTSCWRPSTTLSTPLASA